MTIGKLLATLFLTCLFCFPPACFALRANELLLIGNSRVAESLKLARYYQVQRNVPADQLLQVSMPTTEDCSRSEYQTRLVDPVRRYLDRHPDKNIRALVLFYGIPLRVKPPELNKRQQRQLADLHTVQKRFKAQLASESLTQEQVRVRKTALKETTEQIDRLKGEGSGAALDAEIALVKVSDYPLQNWLANPYFVGFGNQQDYLQLSKDQIMLVSRLDGPDPAVVIRMIDESLEAEKSGLRGKAYFDARWPLTQKKDLKSYALYDASLHKAASLTQKISSLDVHIDQQERLLQNGEAPDAALYCGWYSLGAYVDAFDWRPGAVAYHIASSECTTLKKPDSQVWCKALLEDGVAATLGPVAEPYVQGFPPPELFFAFLLDGYYTLAESYILSLPYLSWQMILVGDPLYRPFLN